jgi:hypothetical protein
MVRPFFSGCSFSERYWRKAVRFGHSSLMPAVWRINVARKLWILQSSIEVQRHTGQPDRRDSRVDTGLTKDTRSLCIG